MKIIKSVQLKKVVVSLRFISVNCYGVFVGNQRATKIGNYDEADLDFCNALKVLLEEK